MRIACPKCSWEPTAGSRWTCTCGHRWNTFDTGGRCPACRTLWKQTQCLACSGWSPHVDWYRDLPPVDELLEARPEAFEAAHGRAAEGPAGGRGRGE